MTDIFLSYNREDQAVARRFAEAFAAAGFDVWWDATLKSGEAYDEVTEAALRGAKAVVVLWSPRSVVSRWVRAEATLADRNKTLVPCTIEPCDRPIMFELTQTAELSHWQGDVADKAWQAFLGDVRRFVGTSAQTETHTPAVAAPLALPSKPSIAVMPFTNLSGDPDQAYFVDGMLVEIVEALSRCRSIFVIASGSSLSFKGKSVSARDAAQQLGVRYILEGSVRKAGTRIRIGVQLIDAAESQPIWTERFEDTLEDIFHLQDKVALAVAGKIEPTLEIAELRRLSGQPTASLGSYDLYLRALPPFRTFAKERVFEALDLVNRAIALDENFGPALALAACCHRAIYTRGWSGDSDAARRQGLELAQRALRAAGDDSETLARVASVLIYLGDDPDIALNLADRALLLNPGSSLAWHLSGVIRLRAGLFELSIAHTETAIRLDPTHADRPLGVGFVGEALFQQRRFREALGPLREAAQLMDTSYSLALFAACLGQCGLLSEAQSALRRYRAITSQPTSDMARTYMRDPDQRQLFLEGIALAEGPPLEPTAR